MGSTGLRDTPAIAAAVPGSAPIADELRAYCCEYLTAYKCPRQWEFLGTFPLTPSGKIQKFKLRERLNSTPRVYTSVRPRLRPFLAAK